MVLSWLCCLCCLALLLATQAFFLPPPSSERQRQRVSRPRKLATTVWHLASSDPAEGDASSNDQDEAAAATAKSGVTPKPFLTRRMRRGPIGSSSSSSKQTTVTDHATPSSTAAAPDASDTPAILKVSQKWACVANCGACCYLAPAERPFLMDYFEDPDDLAQYNGMVGDDGWCVHYDKAKRACTVFEDRPWFCRVEGQTFERMYGVTAPEMDKFCTSCCREQIADVYGTSSTEMTSFNTAIKHLKAAAAATDEPPQRGFGKKGPGKAKDGVAAAPVPVPIDPFTGEASDKPAAKADWV